MDQTTVDPTTVDPTTDHPTTVAPSPAAPDGPAGPGPGGPPRERDSAATRSRIVASARAHFARSGYDGTTVRAVAAGAGVAPNLISRYFGGKAGLFAAASAGDLDLATVLPGPPAHLGARIARKVVSRWEGARHDDPMVMLIRSAGTSEAAAAALRQFFHRRAVLPLATHLVATRGTSQLEAEATAAAVCALITGTVTNRYVVGLTPLASARPASVEGWLGRHVQQLIDGDGGSTTLEG